MMDQICLGKLQDAHETIQRALVLSQDHHNIWAIAWARYNLNHVLLEQGAYEQAQQSILEALESIRQVPNTVTHFYALVIYSFTLQELGLLDKSFKTMEEALALIQAFPVPTYQALLLPWMCVNRGLAGDWETATQYAIYTRPLRASADAILFMMGFTSPYETEALLRGGYVEWAHEEVEQLGRRMGINRRFHICYLRSRALLAQYDGKPEQAIVFLHEAASLAEEIGIPRECWQILIQMGKLYKDLHQPQQATAAFAQASTIVQTLADRIQDETLRQRFLEAHQTILPLVRIDAG
jgi:tetratricopeptide (TPR) repeat protein